MSATRRRMKARIRISLNSASRPTNPRRSSPAISRNSPALVTRPRTRHCWPEIMVISPVNSAGSCFTMRRSLPSTSGCTISIAPESRTKNGTLVSPGSNRISPGSTLRTCPQERMRSICPGVKVGKVCVTASRALGIGGEDIFLFSQRTQGVWILTNARPRHYADCIRNRPSKSNFEPDRDLYSGLIRLHVLHHAAEEPIFGLGMAEELARHGYRISPGTLYPLLHGLEKKGYLRSFEQRNGKSLRKVYRATAQGRR